VPHEDQAIPRLSRAMPTSSHFLLCVANEGASDLQLLKLYRWIPDDLAEGKGFVRVVDESGEDYLYPRASFVTLPLPRSVEEQLDQLAAAFDR
jgi:hypothetical protein